MDFTLDGEQTALRDAVRGLLKGFDDEHRREVVARGPRLRRGAVGPARRDGPARPARSARTTAAWAPARSSSRSWPRSSAASSRPSRTSRPSCWPAASSPRSAPPSRRRRSSAALSAGELVLAAALLEPGRRWDLAADGVTENDGTPHRRQGARARRRPRRPVRRLCGPRARLFLVTPARASSARRTAPSTAAAPPASPSTGARPSRWATARSTRPPAPRRVAAATKIAYCHEALGADGLGAEAHHRLPHHPQAVRDDAEPLPGADLPRGRHVHLARADPQHRHLGDDGARRPGSTPRSR